MFPENDLFVVMKLESGEGEVRVQGMLDRETMDEYTITILARDGGIHVVHGLVVRMSCYVTVQLHWTGGLKRRFSYIVY